MQKYEKLEKIGEGKMLISCISESFMRFDPSLSVAFSQLITHILCTTTLFVGGNKKMLSILDIVVKLLLLLF
jgi:hypothetical protein